MIMLEALPVMKTYYLLEEIDSIQDDKHSELVSLNPLISVRLLKQGIHFIPIEAFYEEESLRHDRSQIFQEQLDWFGQFDDYLKQSIRLCQSKGLDLASLNFQNIKYFIDPVMIQSKIVREFLKRIPKDSEIIYVCDAKRPEGGSGRPFVFEERFGFFKELFALACSELGHTRFSVRSVQNPDKPEPSRKTPPSSDSILQRLKNGIKSFAFAGKYGGLSGANKESDLAGQSILFLHSGSKHLDPCIHDYVSSGADVYVYCEGRIHRIDRLGPSTDLSALDTEGDLAIEKDCLRAAEGFAAEGRPILQWLDDQCGMPVSGLLIGHFQTFVRETCSRSLKRSLRYGRFFKEKSIRFVVTHTATDLDSSAALLAVKSSAGVQSICIQHGSHTFQHEVMLMSDLHLFDYYVAGDGISEEYLSQCVQRSYVDPCQIVLSGHYLQSFESEANPSPQAPRSKKRKVLYIPSKILGHKRLFHWMIYPAGWYFDFQKQLFQYFKSRPEYEFIYKSAVVPGRRDTNSAIRALFTEKLPNLRVTDEPVLRCLQEADAVVVDRPTTAFFEAIAFGSPVLALYPDMVANALIPRIHEKFGLSLAKFSSGEEAFSKMDDFLRSDLSGYRPHLVRPLVNIAEEIDQLAQQPKEQESLVASK